jgi:hypothetical protein
MPSKTIQDQSSYQAKNSLSMPLAQNRYALLQLNNKKSELTLKFRWG